VLAKGRSSRNREEKKPKAAKKAVSPAPTFLHPKAANEKQPVKGNAKS
jgi:hypothetical protein